MRLDKKDWKKVKLGDVAYEYSKRVNKPSESGLSRFVGSANIGRFDFRVKSWGSTDDVESSMKAFSTGDYLLVRRSLYASDFRERAPRADFDGVCSGDILTIRENKEEIVDGFLIGVLNNPLLWQYVVANASGSITRRIKWRDLANYEFLLPPPELQAKLAELLWAADEVVERYGEMEKELNKVSKLKASSIFRNSERRRKLGEVLIPLKNVRTPPHTENRYIGLEHIESGERKLNNWAESKDVNSNCFEFSSGNILYSKLRPYLDKAVIANFSGISTTEVLVYTASKDAISDYILEILHSEDFIQYAVSKSYGTKMPRLSHEIIFDYECYIPSVNLQKEHAQQLNSFHTVKDKVKMSIKITKLLQRQLINQIFG